MYLALKNWLHFSKEYHISDIYNTSDQLNFLFRTKRVYLIHHLLPRKKIKNRYFADKENLLDGLGGDGQLVIDSGNYLLQQPQVVMKNIKIVIFNTFCLCLAVSTYSFDKSTF